MEYSGYLLNTIVFFYCAYVVKIKYCFSMSNLLSNSRWKKTYFLCITFLIEPD